MQKLDISGNIEVTGDINHLIRIDLIADVIFYYLQIEDLNNSRLVCKLWDEKIRHILRKSWTNVKIINLVPLEKLTEFQNVMKKPQEKRIFCKFYSTIENFLSLGPQFFTQHQPKVLKIHHNSEDKTLTKIDDLLTIYKWSSNSLKEITLNEICKTIIFPERKDFVDFDLPQLEKISISGKLWKIEDQVDIFIYTIFSKIVKKAPNLINLKLYQVPATKSYNFMKRLKTNQEILSKLQEFSIFYDYTKDVDDFENYHNRIGTQRTGPCDLIEMYENGLQNLKSFHLKLNFYRYKKDKLAPDFGLITKFLQGQSSQLKTLGLNIVVNNGLDLSNNFQLKLPIFPKLRQLFLKNVYENDGSYYFPYVMMDLWDQFPTLHEIHLSLRFSKDFQASTSNSNSMFTGSCKTVQIFRLTISGNFLGEDENQPCKYLPLENFFPNVKKLELDDNFQFIIQKGEGKNPWEKSLEIFSIIFSYTDFDDFDFGIFLPFKGLGRIEVTNAALDWKKRRTVQSHKFDMESFKKLQIKSLKIHKYLLYREDVKQIRAMCIFDYSPEKPEFAYTNEYIPVPHDDDD